MRGTTRLATLVAVVLGVAGCAHDVEARFPAAAGEATGVVELVFSTPASAVSVAVNGQLLVHDRRTERVTITQVPVGYAELAIAAGPGEKQLRVWVDADRKTSVPLPSAGEAPASALRQFALSLASVALYALLR